MTQTSVRVGRRDWRRGVLTCCLVVLGLLTPALPGGEPRGGWRGNGTGIWSTGAPPLDWHRLPQGALNGLRSQPGAPADEQSREVPSEAPLVHKGQIRSWLILGPYSVPEEALRGAPPGVPASAVVMDFDPVGNEAELRPGQEIKEPRKWLSVEVPPDDPRVFGEAGVPWLNLKPTLGFQHRQVAYAHAYLFSPRGGPVRLVADHSWGLKVWLNGQVVFRQPDRQVVLGGYANLSRLELEHSTAASSSLSAELRPGWNRLLLKLSTPPQGGHEELLCNLRIMDPPDVAYDTRHVAWLAELPGRSTSTPILVQDRLLVMAEPDELICLDKLTGRQLWTAQVNLYEALSPDERAAQPAYAARVDALVAELRRTTDPWERIRLRGRIEAILVEWDRRQFLPPRDGHFDAHFGIVGYTMPTPVSDGERVYVWSGQGVAACFDLEGRRQWITRVSAGELTYASTPALADGVLVVFLNRLFGIQAETGKVLWEQPRVNKNVASLLSARLAGRDVVVTQEGEVVSPRDGELLYRPRGIVKNDTGWTPGVILGDLLYLPKYGVKQLSIVDFSGQTGRVWQPQVRATLSTPAELDRRPDGSWLDRSTAASPLVVDRYAYMVDMYSELCVFDLEAGRLVHYRTLPLDGFTHYNALAVAASPTLVAGHLLILDNQGTTLVLTTGPEPQLVHHNVLATQLARTIPLPAQETLAYAPPLVDGDRLYLRGERYLYCIGRDTPTAATSSTLRP
ncbi:MAG: PQQ-binding-like beta-propeller repeat protein [Pirellulales bacterium]